MCMLTFSLYRMRIVLSRFLSTRHIQHTDATDCTEALRKLVESQQGNEDAVTQCYALLRIAEQPKAGHVPKDDYFQTK